jgi:hypothetical protein
MHIIPTDPFVRNKRYRSRRVPVRYKTATRSISPPWWSGKFSGVRGRSRIRLSSLLLLVVVALLAAQVSRYAHAQRPAQSPLTTWSALSSAEFDKYQYIFSPYNIASAVEGIVVLSWSTIKIFRIELAGFCYEQLCLTIVVFECGRPTCPSTAVFADKVVRFDKTIVRHFGGTSFIRFPLGKDRSIGVMINRYFVSAWQGLGPPEK